MTSITVGLIRDILEKRGDEIVYSLRKSLKDNNRIATGKTAQGIEWKVSDTTNYTTLTIEAPSHITFLEDGRKPSKSKGGSGFLDELREWMKARNIFSQGMTPEQLEFLIYRKINKVGFQGTTGLISNIINQSLFQKIENEVAEKTLEETFQNIKVTVQ